MANNGPFAGVISPEMLWSANGNELRVHSTASLEPHAGHGTTGLPAQALFRFSSDPDPDPEQKWGTFRRTGKVPGSVLEAAPPAKRTKSPPASPTLALSSPAAAAANQRTDAQDSSFAVTGADVVGTRGSGSPAPASGGNNAAESRAVGAGRNGDGAADTRHVGSSGGGGVSPRERGATGKGAAGKLSVRAVEAVETRDGRTVLVCLVSERGLPSEIHCVDPASGETLRVATGLPILLTSLAVVPVPRRSAPRPRRPFDETLLSAGETGLSPAHETRDEHHGAGGVWLEPDVGDAGDGGGDGEEVVVAVGGVGGRVALVGLQLPANPQGRGEDDNLTATTAQRAPFRSWPQQHPHAGKTRSAGGVPSEREGVPITSLAAFSVPDHPVDGHDGLRRRRSGCARVAMVAAGWSDGSWAVAPCCDGYADSAGGGGAPSADEDLGGELDGGEGRDAGGVSSSLLSSSSLSLAEEVDLATGDTGGLGPALHFTYQEDAVLNGLSRADGRPSKFRLWVSTASGFLCFEAFAAKVSSPQVLQPIFRQKTTLIAGVRPQSLRAMPVGGGPPRPVMVFASTRPSDGAPVLTILDTDTAISSAATAAITAGSAGAGTSGPLSPGLRLPVGGDAGGGGRLSREGLGLGFGVGEVELSTRCCSKSVFAASPHAVFVHPAGIKAFVCSGGDGAGGGRGGHGGEGEDFSAASQVPQHPPSSSSGGGRVHLKFSMVVAEASLSEGCGGKPTLRAWEQTHVGDAHEVAEEVERLGLLAFCEPSEGDLDANTARRIDAMGEASLEHVVGGPDNLWARPFVSREESSSSSDDDNNDEDNNNNNNSNNPGISARDDGAPTAAATAEMMALGGEEDEGTGLSVPLMLLAARLQAAVAMGRGPVVARTLTATVPPFGGEWMLPHARPVQEWAASVALEAWGEACSLLARLNPDAPSSSSPSAVSSLERVEVSALDAVARRSRQVERIVDASIERCRQYCEAANAQQPANPAGTPRQHRLRPNAVLAQQLAAASRLAETAPLLSHLRRAALAAHLAARLASTASWLFAAGLLRLPASAAATAAVGVERGAAAGVGDGLVGRSLSRGDGDGDGGGGGNGVSAEVPGLVRPTPVHVCVPPMRMVNRLRERAGLVSSTSDEAAMTAAMKDSGSGKAGSEGAVGDGSGFGGGDGGGGGNDVPGVVLVRMSSMLRHAFADAGEDGCGATEDVAGSGLLGSPAKEEGRGCAAVRSLLEKGLTVVAYSVMNAAFKDRALSEGQGRGSTLGAVDGFEGEAEERTTLERVEALAEVFYEQARMSPESRVQARISWLLDHGTSTAADASSGGGCPPPRSLLLVSTAAAALLRPRTSACLATDPDLVALAGAILAKFGGGGSGGGDGDGEGGGEGGRAARQTAVFLPLAEDLLRAAGGAARERLLTSGRKRPRDGSPSPTPFGGGEAPAEELTVVYDSGQHQQKRPTPAKHEQHEQQPCPAASTPLQRGSDNGLAPRRDRGCTVWETPRGVGLTPKTPGARRGLPMSATRFSADDDAGSGFPNSSSSTYRQPRERGQTVWETPRGVGLTPKTPGARRGLPMSATRFSADDVTGSGFPGSTSSTHRQPRERGQTVWETPRGVGLTPKTPGARRGLPMSAPRYDAGDITGSGFPGSKTSTHQQPRERGQTVWETPRGVGLTPRKTLGTSAQDDRRYSTEPSDQNGDYTGGGVEESKGEVAPSGISAYKQPRARGQTVWETPRGVGLTPRAAGAAGRATTTTPISAREGCSPAAWPASGSSAASPGVGGQPEVRAYAQGGL